MKCASTTGFRLGPISFKSHRGSQGTGVKPAGLRGNCGQGTAGGGGDAQAPHLYAGLKVPEALRGGFAQASRARRAAPLTLAGEAKVVDIIQYANDCDQASVKKGNVLDDGMNRRAIEAFDRALAMSPNCDSALTGLRFALEFRFSANLTGGIVDLNWLQRKIEPVQYVDSYSFERVFAVLVHKATLGTYILSELNIVRRMMDYNPVIDPGLLLDFHQQLRVVRDSDPGKFRQDELDAFQEILNFKTPA